jgi:hypothetical protein
MNSQQSSPPPSLPPAQPEYTVTGVSIAVENATGCTPGAVSAFVTVQLDSPSEFPVSTPATTSGDSAELAVQFLVSNPSSTPHTIKCIWTYAPFIGDYYYSSGSPEEYFQLQSPASGLPITLAAGGSQDISFSVGVDAAANDQTVQLVFGLSS